MALPPDRPDFTDLARPSERKALQRLAELDSTIESAPPEVEVAVEAEADVEEGRGPTGAVIGALIVPGAPSLFRRTKLSMLLLIVGFAIPVATVVVALIRRNQIASLLLDKNFLLGVQAIAVLFVVTRLISVIEVVRSRRPGSPRRMATTLAMLGVMVVALPAVWSVARVNDLTSVISDVFISSGSDEPLAASATDSAATKGDFKTILLLGGDEGPGRWALRTDTMILLTIHQDSGRMAMISIPRNLTKIEFPPGSAMANEFSQGFPELANAIYPYVFTHEDISATYVRGELQPEAIALASGISYSMNITIDDYVLINMQGFLEIIDALGGVTMTLDEQLPMPGNVPGAKTQYPPFIGPGEVTMDGTTALGFARSRSADSDYRRMGRQRQLLTALMGEVSGSDVLLRFPDLAEIMRWTVRTSLTSGEFSSLVNRLRSGASINESIGLIPPLINPSNPDFADISNLIDALQAALRDNVDFPFA